MTLSFAPEAIEQWSLDRLRPYARNAKTHGPDQIAKIAASIAEFGWTVPVLGHRSGSMSELHRPCGMDIRSTAAAHQLNKPMVLNDNRSAGWRA